MLLVLERNRCKKKEEKKKKKKKKRLNNVDTLHKMIHGMVL